MVIPQTLVREHFEGQASLWKEIYESDTVEGAVYRTRQDKVLAIAERLPVAPDAREDARVLELGCGAGWNVVALAQRGYRVHAVDLVPRMLVTTREVCDSRHVGDRVTRFCADAEALPFADGYFDVVIGIALLEWVSSAKAFGEIARVMRPGGYAILTATNRWSLQRCLDPLLNPAMEPVKNAVRRMSGARAHSRTHSLREIDRSFAAAGLIRQEALTAGFGPFTFFKRKLLPGPRGARLHHLLQRFLSRAGYAHIVMAVKP